MTAPIVPSILCGDCGRVLLKGSDGYVCVWCKTVALATWRVHKVHIAEGYATPEEPLLSDTVDEDLGVV